MLLVHQAGSVHVGEVVRYTLTYTPSADRILPSPAHLYVKVKNTSPIPLRAAYLHGPYSLHVSAYPSTFNPHQKVADPDKTGVPEFEPFLKAGANWTCKLTVPEDIRETGATFANDRGSMDSMTEKGRQKERKSVTWIIEVASQVIFSTSAGVHFEVLVGRDERSLDLGFAAVAGHGHGGPGDIKDHKRLRGEKKKSTKGVYSRAVKLVVEDTQDLWDKPRLPQKVGRERAKSIEEKHQEMTQEELKEKEAKKQKVHLVILTHGLHSNLSADMLYMKESIDATVAQARADARERRAKRKAQNEGRSKASTSQGTDDVQQNQEPATEALTGGQEDLEDEEDEEQVVVRGFAGNAVRTERGIQYLGKRLAKYVLHLTYPSQPYLPIKKTMSQSISSKLGGSQNQKVADTKCPASHAGSSIHHDAEHPHENNQAYEFTSISFIGHSLGGLVQLYAIAYIQKHAPAFFKLIQPVNFVCMASPLLGLSNENPMYIKFALDFGLVGRTGQDLGLTWRAPTIAKSGWSAMGGVFGNNQKDQKEEDPGAKPLLRILPTGPAHQVLHLFRNRTLYSNVVNDGIVPLRTSCLLFLDWKGLGKVEKFRRENGLIGTMVEWGWAEVTGANADRDMSVSPRPKDREFSDSGTNTPTRQGDGETVPQPSDSVTEDDNKPSGTLGPSISQYLQPRTDNDSSTEPRASETGPQQNGATSSMFSDFWNFFKPASSQPTEKKSPKALKALQRAQTLSQEQEEEANKAAASNGQEPASRPSFSRGTTDNPTMRPTKSRPVASRGDSLDNPSSSLSAPPKTSVFEAASDILHPPVPSTQWLVDPASRPRTIFHDRVYHPSDIPPPPQRRPSRLSRSFSSEQNSQLSSNNKAPSLRSTDSTSSLTSDQGGMKVEEKIARAYHRDLSWRKVLVKLEPDAHNNMIVRRMFANAYGWPVVKHLCDTHFGDTFSANTRDEDEPNIDRANPGSGSGSASNNGPAAVPNETPISLPKRKEGEEVSGQTSRHLPERSGSEVREGRDELGSLDISTEGIAAVENKHRHDTQDTWGEHFFSESSDDEGVYRADGKVDVNVTESSPVLERQKKERPTPHLLHTGDLPKDGRGGSPDIILSPSELADRLVEEPGDLSDGSLDIGKGKSTEEAVIQTVGSPGNVGLKKDVNAAMTESLTEDKGEGLGIVERVVDATAKIEALEDPKKDT
ncbi:putative serine esterase-domain-containing protein [Elsinoe ampelina]|uniref:Putative serine esterase-domain-containing protein n=1 Tax=Elsinoe ampelina TaxID=302913 RepID=A0A6A6GIV6_9PEZI|nr:putative serine esterase-domain-containing protein [Elsinoe ampelina]